MNEALENFYHHFFYLVQTCKTSVVCWFVSMTPKLLNGFCAGPDGSCMKFRSTSHKDLFWSFGEDSPIMPCDKLATSLKTSLCGS